MPPGISAATTATLDKHPIYKMVLHVVLALKAMLSLCCELVCEIAWRRKCQQAMTTNLATTIHAVSKEGSYTWEMLIRLVPPTTGTSVTMYSLHAAPAAAVSKLCWLLHNVSGPVWEYLQTMEQYEKLVGVDSHGLLG